MQHGTLTDNDRSNSAADSGVWVKYCAWTDSNGLGAGEQGVLSDYNGRVENYRGGFREERGALVDGGGTAV